MAGQRSTHFDFHICFNICDKAFSRGYHAWSVYDPKFSKALWEQASYELDYGMGLEFSGFAYL